MGLGLRARSNACRGRGCALVLHQVLHATWGDKSRGFLVPKLAEGEEKKKEGCPRASVKGVFWVPSTTGPLVPTRSRTEPSRSLNPERFSGLWEKLRCHQQVRRLKLNVTTETPPKPLLMETGIFCLPVTSPVPIT